MDFSTALLLILIFAAVFYGVAKTLLSKSKTPAKDSTDLNREALLADTFSPEASASAGTDDNDQQIAVPEKGFHGKSGRGTDKKSSAKSRASGPYEPPPVPPNFVGRADEIKEILSKPYRDRILITGEGEMGGIGKTALALRLAEKLASRFTDGRIFISLRGSTPNPLSAGETMSRIIWAYHPKMKLPEDEEELKSTYQSVLQKKKKTLLILDDAADLNQINPLIPFHKCFLLVTARQSFILPGFLEKKLSPLTSKESRELLLALAPDAGVVEKEISKLCGFHPMALCISGGLIGSSEEWTPARFSTQLRGKQHNVKQVEQGNRSSYVDAPLKITYSSLDKKTASVLNKLSTFPGTFSIKAEEFVCQDFLGSGLAQLVKRGLVFCDEKNKRYQLHPLIGEFAAEKVTQAEQGIAAKRHATYYLTLMLTANDYLTKESKEDFEKGLDLFDLEWENIAAGQAWAEANHDEDDDAAGLCSAYSEAAVRFLELRRPREERIRWFEAALSATRRLNDREAELAQLVNLGGAFLLGSDDFLQAREYYKQALELASDLGDQREEAKTLDGLGFCHSALNHYPEAIESFKQALVIYQNGDDYLNERNTLSHLGDAYKSSGEINQAIPYYEQALELSRETGDRRGEGKDLETLGKAFAERKEYGRAVEFHEQALDIFKKTDNRLGRGNSLWQISQALAELGDLDNAVKRGEDALKIFQPSRHPDALMVSSKLREWRHIATGDKDRKKV